MRKYCHFTFLSILLFSMISCSSWQKQSAEEKKAEIYYSHGTAKLMDREYSEALDYLQRANELTPNDSQILNNLAMAYYFKNQYKMAITLLKKSLTVDNKNSDARNNLASIYFKHDNLDAAEREYKTILLDLIYKHQYRVHYNLALIYFARNLREKGTEHLKLAIQENKGYCPAHYKLGTTYKEDGQYEKALKEFVLASDGVCVSSPDPHFQQAVVLGKMGRTREARIKYSEFIERFPENPLKEQAELLMNNLRTPTNNLSSRKLVSPIENDEFYNVQSF